MDESNIKGSNDISSNILVPYQALMNYLYHNHYMELDSEDEEFLLCMFLSIKSSLFNKFSDSSE